MASIRSAEGNWPRIETVAGRLVERKGLLVAIGLGGGKDRVFGQLGRLAAELGRTRMCPFDQAQRTSVGSTRSVERLWLPDPPPDFGKVSPEPASYHVPGRIYRGLLTIAINWTLRR